MYKWFCQYIINNHTMLDTQNITILVLMKCTSKYKVLNYSPPVHVCTSWGSPSNTFTCHNTRDKSHDNHMITDLPCRSSPVWVAVSLEGLWEQMPAKALENASVSDPPPQTDVSHVHCINERSHLHTMTISMLWQRKLLDCITFACTNVYISPGLCTYIILHTCCRPFT